MKFFEELKRRNVYKVAVAYAVVAWLLIQIATQVFPFLQIPEWIIRLVIVLLALGFPIALIIAWAFELTPEGLKRTEAAEALPERKRSHAWIYIAVVSALLSLGLFFAGRYTAGEPQVALSAKSIAVLPFESLSEDKANAYFADGIQDEILTRLSKVADLKVISRTSTQKYKSAPENLREIAQQLGVTHVLEGSVQRSAGQVRVTVQLINAMNDSHLWAESYDRDLMDIFKVESEIAQKIAGTLEAKLTGREMQMMRAGGTKNPQAYDVYLQALAISHGQGQANEDKLVALCRRAVELDPDYLEAWSLLAIAEAQQYFFPNHTEAQLARVRQAAETAVRLGPDTTEAHLAMGAYEYYCLRDWDRALAELKRARELSPNDANVLLWTGLVQRRQGNFDESIASQLAATKLDPLNQDLWVNLGRSYRGQRRFNEARAMFDRALATAPNDPEIIGQKAETYLAQGDVTTAAALVKDLKFLPSDRGFGFQLLLLIFQRRFEEAEAFLEQGLQSAPETPPVFRSIARLTIAHFRLAKGETEKARALLEQAAAEFKTLRAQGDDGLLLADAYAMTEALLGHREEVERVLQANRELIRADLWALPNEDEAAARAYTALGDFDRALPLLKHALTATAAEALTPAFLKLDPFWDRVRDDPRFQELVRP